MNTKHFVRTFPTISTCLVDLRNRYKVNKMNKFLGLKTLSDLDISQYKKSDTLFILGSGGSINDISDREWKLIKEKDSVGFNKWLLHDHVPTFYMFENGIGQGEMYFNFNIKKIDYSKVPIIYNVSSGPRIYLEGFPKELLKNLHISTCFRIPGKNTYEFKKYLRIFAKLLDRLNKDQNRLLHIHKTGSISDLLLFAIQMGYREIVLMGVDLKNITYFFEVNKNYYEEKHLKIPDTGQKGRIHLTFNKEYNFLTIDLVIMSIYEQLLKPLDVKVYIGSKKSALYPELPYYWDKEGQ